MPALQKLRHNLHMDRSARGNPARGRIRLSANQAGPERLAMITPLATISPMPIAA